MSAGSLFESATQSLYLGPADAYNAMTSLILL